MLCSIVWRHSRSSEGLGYGKTEVADLEIAVLVDENVAGLEIAVDDACRVDIFQTALLID